MRTLIPTIFEEFEEICNALTCCKKAPLKTTSFGVSVREDSNNIYFEVPIPGIKAEEVELLLEKESRTLSIKAEHKKQVEEEVKYHVEADRIFFYKIPLPNSINMEGKIEAVSKDGILTVAIQKNRGAESMKIEVKVA